MSNSKKIPGNWVLFELFFDEADALFHKEKKDLEKENVFFEIQFSEEGKFIQKNNSKMGIIENLENGEWSISKNFITLIQEDFRKNVEFQFAIEKGVLKLLKKDNFGKIEFFGFFKKLK